MTAPAWGGLWSPRGTDAAPAAAAVVPPAVTDRSAERDPHAAATLAACGSRSAERSVTAGGTTAAAAGAASVPRGDHNPPHAGAVMMKGDLHSEGGPAATGRSHQVY